MRCTGYCIYKQILVINDDHHLVAMSVAYDLINWANKLGQTIHKKATVGTVVN